jgi:hypothetical protein
MGMAATTTAERRSLSPPEQLRVELEDMKRIGLTFGHAWRIAKQRVIWPHDKVSRREWKQVIEGQRAEWENCYLDAGTPIDFGRLLVVLADQDFEDILRAA